MRIEPLYEEFLTYLAVERNCAKLTVEAYQSDGRMFLRFLEELGSGPDVEAVTKHVLRQYVVWLRERGLQPATVARRIHSLRSFWNYLWDCEYTDDNPFRKLTLPKQSRKLPTYLPEDDCRRLIDAAGEQASAFLSCRDRAILVFMLFTGARRSEVLGLTWDAVDLEELTVRFVGAKGDKSRAVPLAEPAAEALREWAAVRPNCQHRYVFTTQWGARLGKRGLCTTLDRALRAADIDTSVTPHKLRHSFACMMLRNGADLNCLQRMLGHTRLDTTGVYLQATAEDLREAMARHPLGG
ncbi:MAG: tyrosine-type recombinase/integrase [Armatimonadetes bacterium]|nr:tyrosine-type recombinase/integrase [Armatimonadota bacterium]